MAELAFHTDVQPIPDIAEARTIRVRGRVTYRDAPEFRDAILTEIDRTSASKLVLELGQVEHMDTSGAAVLAEALKRGQQRGLQILLCSASDSVLRTFRLAGFEDILGHCCADIHEIRERLLQ